MTTGLSLACLPILGGTSSAQQTQTPLNTITNSSSIDIVRPTRTLPPSTPSITVLLSPAPSFVESVCPYSFPCSARERLWRTTPSEYMPIAATTRRQLTFPSATHHSTHNPYPIFCKASRSRRNFAPASSTARMTIPQDSSMVAGTPGLYLVFSLRCLL